MPRPAGPSGIFRRMPDGPAGLGMTDSGKMVFLVGDLSFNAPMRLFVLATALCLLAAAPAPSPLSTYDAVVKLVQEHYYDKTFGGVAFDKAADESRRALTPKSTDSEVTVAVNSLLQRLGRSHTQFLTPADQEYWALKSIFSGILNGASINHVGIWFERKGARWFARNVLPGGSAAEAGLVRGDEIMSIDGNPVGPIASFVALKPGDKVSVTYRRLPWQEPQTASLKVVHSSIQAALLKSMKSSWLLHTQDGKSVAYFWLPTGTHPDFKQQLKQFVSKAADQADALVLDLRDGFGGADPTFLEPFFQTDPSGPAPTFTKPMVTLVNEGTRSGKEWLAWSIQGQKRGPLVGTRTAGAFLAAKLFDVEPLRYALYLPVGGTKGIGVELEGVGVTPDVVVTSPLSYAAGGDPQLMEALKLAAKSAAAH
jgi:carboxyl-terminal processing protease